MPKYLNNREMFKAIKQEIAVINLIMENIKTDKEEIRISETQAHFLELHTKKLGEIVGIVQ